MADPRCTMANRFRKAHGAHVVSEVVRAETLIRRCLSCTRAESPVRGRLPRVRVRAWASNVSSANHVWRHDHLPRPRPWPAGGSKRTAVTFLTCSLVEIRWAYTDCPRKRSLGMAVSTTSRHRKRRSAASRPGTSRPSIAMLSNSAIRRLASRRAYWDVGGHGYGNTGPIEPPESAASAKGLLYSAGNPTWSSCHVDDVLRGC